MKVLSAYLLLTLLVASSFGCCWKDCGCGCSCGGLNLGGGSLGGYNYGYSNPYAAAYNPYNPYGSAGCCNPLTTCLLKKLKPCLVAKSLLMKKMCKKNLIARKLMCSW